MLSQAAANVVEAQKLQARRRQERVENIVAAGEALRELGFDKKSKIAAFVAEFSGVSPRHAENILAAGASPSDRDRGSFITWLSYAHDR